MSAKIKVPKPHKMWALFNYGRLMAVKFAQKDFAEIFCGGKDELKADIQNGSINIQRVRVSVIPKKKARK